MLILSDNLGERNFNRFGGWLGKNSTFGKNLRLLQDLHVHLLASRSGREGYYNNYRGTCSWCSSWFSSRELAPEIYEQTESIDVCVEDETVNYLNRLDVQKALHARLVGVWKWAVCNNVLDYELLDLEIPTINIVGKLIKEEISVLVYSSLKFYYAPKNKKSSRKDTKWETLHGIPQQKDHNTCGYYIMRFMKEIVQDKDLGFGTKWRTKSTSGQYNTDDIDAVRAEWAKYVKEIP